jgi:hypothetical protein
MRRHLIALATLLALFAGAPASSLASGADVIDDCTDDEVMAKVYTQKEYREALAKLPADADQYGNCRDIIARAQEAAATRGGSGKARKGGGFAVATPADGGTGAGHSPAPSTAPAREQLAGAAAEDRAAAKSAASDPSTPTVGPADAFSTAGVGRAPESGTISDLPTPVLVLLALLLAGALALAAARIRSLVHTRRA